MYVMDVFNLTGEEFNALKWQKGQYFDVLVGVNVVFTEPIICWYNNELPAYDTVLLYGYKNGKKIIFDIGFYSFDAGIDDGLYVNYAEID